MDGKDKQSGKKQRSFWKKKLEPQPSDNNRTSSAPAPEQANESQGENDQPERHTTNKRQTRKRSRKQKPTLVLSDTQELIFSTDDGDTTSSSSDGAKSRGVRQSTPSRRRLAGLSASPQELQLWLQQGGWRFFAAGAFLLILAIVVILSLHRTTRSQALRIEPTSGVVIPQINVSPVSVDGVSDPSTQPQVLPAEQAGQPQTTTTLSIPDTSSVAPSQPTSSPEIFIVFGTGTEGLRLREKPNATSLVLATVRDGTHLEKRGEDVTGDGFTWRNVRTPDGVEGWVARDWLQPAP